MIKPFALDWLRLRERLDTRARDRGLARRFGACVAARAGGLPAALVDLGAGSGANFRALAPLIPGDQAWRLIDCDPALLSHQSAEIAQWARSQGYRVTHGPSVVTIAAGSAQWRTHSVNLDLAATADGVQLAAAHGVCCAALLDLVSGSWVNLLARRLAAAALPFHAGLIVDGRRVWAPGHHDDSLIEDAFARHQRTDKGFGLALGPIAAAHTARHLQEFGYRVVTAASDWQVGPADDAILAALIDGAADAALEVEPGSAERIAAWRRDRQDARDTGRLRLTVGHVDIFAEADETRPVSVGN
jgi:hypothetical protein